MADFCGFLEGSGSPSRIATNHLEQRVMMANAIFRPTDSCRVPQQLANQFGPESALTDPAIHTMIGASHG